MPQSSDNWRQGVFDIRKLSNRPYLERNRVLFITGMILVAEGIIPREQQSSASRLRDAAY